MIVGSYELDIREKEGYHLLASTGYWNATPEQIEEHTGGCGPGKLGDHFVPDTMWGESVFLACQIHDWMYWTGRTPQDKRTADLCFLVNMILLVDNGHILDPLRLRRCMTYFQAVSLGGGEAFGK
jgi:hypothetical protein